VLPEDDPDADRYKVAHFVRASLSIWRSPLVRAIALSTAAMVFLRDGLRILGLDAIDGAFAGSDDRIAAFLGAYAIWANVAAIALGLFVTPRLLERAGVGVANVGYALATAAAYALLLFRPSLGAAVAA